MLTLRVSLGGDNLDYNPDPGDISFEFAQIDPASIRVKEGWMKKEYCVSATTAQNMDYSLVALHASGIEHLLWYCHQGPSEDTDLKTATNMANDLYDMTAKGDAEVAKADDCNVKTWVEEDGPLGIKQIHFRNRSKKTSCQTVDFVIYNCENLFIATCGGHQGELLRPGQEWTLVVDVDDKSKASSFSYRADYEPLK